MNPTILIIDDDEKLNQLLKGFLSDFGFKTLTAVHPEQGLKKLKHKSPDLVILDVMLPSMDGFEVCKKIRRSSSIPIIMLTARGELMDKVVGLELGADDYLPKPFEPRELVARIHSVLRRAKKIDETRPQSFGRLEIDFSKHIVQLDGDIADLTTNEFTALALLAGNPGKVFNRDQILQELRGIDCDAFNRSVDITMSRLRQKLDDDPKSPNFIKTVWGTGYVFIGAPTISDHSS
ncbi:MAG: response regulator transcription factor [Desulfobacterales bacterium]|nr:response regulator transcription factor [Deltaproteobacteria bacterium]NNL75536.1 response regulator transcription factor [Desulfobacterales bacterium]